MAKVQARSGLASKLGNSLDAAVDAHKNDETVVNAGGLPAGIEGGIAQVVECKFDTYKSGKQKGEFYYMASARVVEPKTFKDDLNNVITVEGGRTQVGPIPVCDLPDRKTPKTMADQVAVVLNEFRKLGVDTKNATGAQLETIAAAIKASKPFTKFRTWAGKMQEATTNSNGTVTVDGKPYPNMAAAKAANPYMGQKPTVQHDWLGVVAYDGDTAAAVALDGAVADNTGEAADEQEDAGAGTQEAAEDYATLGQQADAGDKDAQSQLQQLATAQGINADDLATWAEVAELLANGGGGGDATGTTAAAAPGDGERPADWKPKVDEPYYFTPAGKRKRVEGAVTTVFEKSMTVNIRNLDDQVVERSVPWNKLFNEGN